MDVNDVYGRMPHRPDTADFWRLSEVVNEADIRMDEAVGLPAKQEVFEQVLGGMVDRQSVSYIALQRAMRALGVVTSEDLAANMEQVNRLTALFIDGFMVGHNFRERGGHRP